MRCKYCGVEIKDNVKVCPLCHEKIDEYQEDAKTVYPKKDNSIKKVKKSRITFNNLYIAIAFPIFLICVAINYVVMPDLLWCWLVFLLEIYGFLFVSNTIKSNSSISLKIVLQTICVFLVITAAIWIFSATGDYEDPDFWVLNYALPFIFGLGNIVLIIFTAINVKKKPSLLVDTIFILLTGYIPIIMYWCKTTSILWPAVTMALISAAAQLCCLAFWHGEVREEIRKKFHM